MCVKRMFTCQTLSRSYSLSARRRRRACTATYTAANATANAAVTAAVPRISHPSINSPSPENSTTTPTAIETNIPSSVGTTVAGKEIFHASRIAELCARLGVHIGIIAAPAAAAQSTCDAMLRGGVRAIWNFAPVHLTLPPGVIVANENLAASFAALSGRLSQMSRGD